MKHSLKKWSIRLFATSILLVTILLVIVLKPALTYAGHTRYGSFTIYHNARIDPLLYQRLNDAKYLLSASELYNPDTHFDICLNDGSPYPSLIRTLRGPAFAWGFYDKVVLQGESDCRMNMVSLNGYKWDLTQLYAHELVHCMQFSALGLLHSNPLARIPEWKWEGYAEYIARRSADQQRLAFNIKRLLDADTIDKNSWAISFPDHTIAPRTYYQYWILVQYCLDVKKMSYKAVLADDHSEQHVYEDMMRWYTDADNS